MSYSERKSTDHTLDNANIQLVSKSVENNLLVGGLRETEDEDSSCIAKVPLRHPWYYKIG